MAEAKSYLTFGLNHSQYGVDTRLVREIFYIPEITPVAGTPMDVVGVINLRGDILPVIDLNYRLSDYPFGELQSNRCQSFALTDSIIVLAQNEVQVGIVVNAVEEVLQIADDTIAPAIASTHDQGYVSGIAKVDSSIIALLNSETILQYSIAIESQGDSLNSNGTSFKRLGRQEGESAFFATATPQERVVLKERADNLRRSPNRQDFAGLVPLAVIGLNQEYFGLDLDAVREFTDIRKITPIPCCPSHIIGNMNLRGEIVTLVDIRKALNLLTSTEAKTSAKAMVVHIDDIVAGILVDDVYDVMYLRPTDINPVPTAINSGNDEYLRGTATYQNTVMSLLDLPKILTRGNMIVDEDV